MEKITRNVRDLEREERQAYESLVGHSLRQNQQIIIQVITLNDSTDEEPSQPHATAGSLPAWCNVFEGLTEKEITEVEDVILRRADLTRPT